MRRIAALSAGAPAAASAQSRDYYAGALLSTSSLAVDYDKTVIEREGPRSPTGPSPAKSTQAPRPAPSR